MLLLSVITSQSLYSQEAIRVTGRVIAQSDAAALPGVSVKLKGNPAGQTTDLEGRFSISVPSGSTLVFSYVGFISQEVQVTDNAPLTITLSEDVKTLNEVVVVGYGTTRKKDLTGSVVVVGSEDFQKGNITTPEQMIAGKVPGVSIISNSGQPGAGSTIRIRGGSSLNANNDPLIVIDGVPLDIASVSGASNPLSFINPNDIASFTILKDASAAAIYGARASNGVIIITTKKGQGGALKIDFSTVNSISNITKYVDVLHADQFRAIVNEYGTTTQKAMLGTANTDWQKEIYQTALSTDNNLSFSGGLKAFPYRVSVGYQDQTGILKTDHLQKVQAALVINPTFFDDHLKVDINLKGSLQKTRFANTTTIGGAVSFDPSQPVRTNSNRFGGYYEWLDPSIPGGLANLQGRNPVGLLTQTTNKGNPLRSIGNVQIDYKFHFLPDLHANLNLGYDIANGKGTTFVTDSAAVEYVVNGNGGLNDKYKQKRENTLADFYLNYVKDLKSIKSRIDVTAGYSYNDYLTTTYNYPSYNAKGVQQSLDPTFPFSQSPKYRLISFLGRANYNYDDRYLLTATLRQDGSSRFGPSNKNGLFPSVALAWTLKNESFLKDKTAISTLKLRLGYGVTGQQNGINDFGYLANYSLSEASAMYQFGDTYYSMYRPSGYVSTLKWEESATTNIGLDFGFLNNRISGTLDVYDKQTKDLLSLAPQAAGTNFTATAFQNIGNMENQGFELSINTIPIDKPNLTWEAGFNITYNKNTITNLTIVPDPNYLGNPTGFIAAGVGGQAAQINAVGGSKSTFNLFQQAYDQAGNPIDGVFIDRDGDGNITPDDRYQSKSADPKLYLGFNSNLTCKKWNAGFVLRANLGNYVYNNNYSLTGTLNQILGTSVLYNASSNYLETGFNGGGFQILSDYYVQNASFLKMDNFNVGYNAGKMFNQKVSVRLNATVQNVFVITKYKGLDPEISSGIDNSLYPRPRMFSLGINLGM